jgi:hypothetical protein
VTIRFAPLASGTFLETAFISSNGGEIAGQLVGVAAGPKLSVTGLKTIIGDGAIALRGLDFGYGGTESFTVRIVGEGTLVGTVTTSASFQVTKSASFSLRAGQRQKVSVKLKKLKRGQSALRAAQIESNGGSDGIQLFASCLKFPKF